MKTFDLVKKIVMIDPKSPAAYIEVR